MQITPYQFIQLPFYIIGSDKARPPSFSYWLKEPATGQIMDDSEARHSEMNLDINIDAIVRGEMATKAHARYNSASIKSDSSVNSEESSSHNKYHQKNRDSLKVRQYSTMCVGFIT